MEQRDAPAGRFGFELVLVALISFGKCVVILSAQIPHQYAAGIRKEVDLPRDVASEVVRDGNIQNFIAAPPFARGTVVAMFGYAKSIVRSHGIAESNALLAMAAMIELVLERVHDDAEGEAYA